MKWSPKTQKSRNLPPHQSVRSNSVICRISRDI